MQGKFYQKPLYNDEYYQTKRKIYFIYNVLIWFVQKIMAGGKKYSTRRRRIWVRLQGAFAGAYLGYVPVDAIP